jgi:hypothetical protein
VSTKVVPPGVIARLEGEMFEDARRIVEVQLAEALLDFEASPEEWNSNRIRSYIGLARVLGAWPCSRPGKRVAPRRAAGGALLPLEARENGGGGLRHGHLRRLERASRDHIEQARALMEGAFPDDADEDEVLVAAGRELQRATRLLRWVRAELA